MMNGWARDSTGSGWFGAVCVLISQLIAQTEQVSTEFTQWPFSSTASLGPCLLSCCVDIQTEKKDLDDLLKLVNDAVGC